jgi:hypothetical protein
VFDVVRVGLVVTALGVVACGGTDEAVPATFADREPLPSCGRIERNWDDGPLERNGAVACLLDAA